ncbi:MAG: hypothetical protein HY560_03540 [Gemmatimonadetes bacterium]|nr:hypothetical protein [Gemmatimonadota bacterium]
MKLDSVQAIVRTLDAAGVRFLVAGGVAVNAHGYRRYTDDLDLVISMAPANVTAAFHALATLGYRPNVPITAEQFADRQLRSRLIREKDMKVLQFWSDSHRETPVDMFVIEPFDFDTEYDRATSKELRDAGMVRVVSIRTLIAMKEAGGREEDRVDISHLRMMERQ